MTCGFDRASFLETQQPFLREILELMETVDKAHSEGFIETVAPSSCAEQGEP